MKFNNVRIVLIETSHPGNIGSTARAMKTMGLNRLYLVDPRSFPDKVANDLAAGADDVLANAIVTQTFSEAIQGCQLVLGASARARQIAITGLTPVESAELIAQTPASTEIALVFGRENSGMTNEELLQCHYHIHIPSNPDFSSLNLAQAVQIITYELRMKLLQPEAFVGIAKDVYATVDEVEQFHEHLREVLIEIDFLRLSNPKRLIQRLRRLFNRAKLERMEVNILRGILTNMQQAINKQKNI